MPLAYLFSAFRPVGGLSALIAKKCAGDEDFKMEQRRASETGTSLPFPLGLELGLGNFPPAHYVGANGRWENYCWNLES